MNFIKDNGGPLVVGAVVIGFFIGYAELRLPRMVDEEMDSRGLISTGDFDQVRKDVEAQGVEHDEDTAEWKRRIEKVVDILLEG
jgi:hypothetical protein